MPIRSETGAATGAIWVLMVRPRQCGHTVRTVRTRFRHRAPFRQDSTCPGGDRGQKENRASLPGARTICYDTLASFRSAFICSRATLAAAVSIGSVD